MWIEWNLPLVIGYALIIGALSCTVYSLRLLSRAQDHLANAKRLNQEAQDLLDEMRDG